MGRKPVCVASGGKQYATFIESLSEENAVFIGFRDGLVLFLGRCWYSLVESLGRRNRWFGFEVPRQTLVRFGFFPRQT